MTTNEQKQWEDYTARELAHATPLLAALGFTLADAQPHLRGERFLMQAVTTTSGRKLILVGQQKITGIKVIMKVSSDAHGIREIEHERTCRARLNDIRFAYQAFLLPKEILYAKKDGHVISVQEFIHQEQPFIERPTKEQFSIALRSFKAQEGAHAATYEHIQRIRSTFGNISAPEYLHNFSSFKQNILTDSVGSEFEAVLTEAEMFLKQNAATIEQYDGFLTHTDFVPHNFRVVGDDVYLLDSSSLRFGNKYEGWARFTNFMALYNPELEDALVTYVRNNRTPEESLAFKLMRVYRLGEIIWYYTRAMSKSSDALHQLNAARRSFWSDVLRAVLKDTQVVPEILKSYRDLRDRLRSPEEKERQIGLH